MGGTEFVNLSLVEMCIDEGATTALNTLTAYGHLTEVLSPNSKIKLPLISDVDEQMILKVFFRDLVTIHSIMIDCENKPPRPDISAPKTIHIFANLPNFDFNGAELVVPHQTIVLNEDSLKKQLRLRGAKFERVMSLEIFVVDNIDGKDRTFINHITLVGRMQNTCDAWYNL